MVAVNCRILGASTTGVQRYLLELLERIPELRQVRPQNPMHGFKGHMWEQFVLPKLVKGSLLWSPSTTGPLAYDRQVITVHDVAPLDHPEWFSKKFAKWYQFITPRICRKAQHIITDSEYSKTRILHHCPIQADKVTVITLGVDPRFSIERYPNLASLTEELRLPSSKYILCVGSLEPRKNLARLLLAWEKICRFIPDDIWLVISGKLGPLEVFSKVEALKSLPPRVHLTGYIEDRRLPSLYAGAMVFAYPSLYEGFGFPPLEAMAAGVPVLTSNTTSIPEVVGNCAVTVEPENVDSIADGLKRLIMDGDLRATFREEGVRRARDFNWVLCAQKTWSLLRSLDS